MLVILEIKIPLASTKKSLYQCHPLILGKSVHKGTISKIPQYINIFIIYLHVIEACLKVTIATFYFCPSKNPSDVMKNIFNSISI